MGNPFMNHRFVKLAALLMMAVLHPAQAEDARPWVPLIQGPELTAWKLPEEIQWVWSLKDGVVRGVTDPKARGHELWTAKAYGDFTLQLEWRFPDPPQKKQVKIILPNGADALNADGSKQYEERLFAGDSGILIRGEVLSQINISCKSAGSGELYGYRKKKPGVTPELKAACVPRVHADLPAGEWNRFVITARGNHVTVELNGQTVIQDLALPDLPASGPIALQHHGEGIEFRNIAIREN